MIRISTYSGLVVWYDQKEEYKLSKRQVLAFKYAEPIALHYLYRVDVYIHIAVHHDGSTKNKFGLYNSWIPHRCSMRLFAFFIACTEVNSFLCFEYFLKKDEEFRGFRLRLYYSLTHNEFLGYSSDRYNLENLRNNKGAHHLETEPSHANKWRG